MDAVSNENAIFDRFPDFIKEYIYAHGWSQLKEIQVAAAASLFYHDSNLLLTSSTASGKTEAAFFPILSDLYDNPVDSVGVLYVAPLKSLINDQFSRMTELLDASGIPVTHWHGDVASSQKKKLLDNPKGILQITPESLEAMLIRRSNDVPRIFRDLRYVIIDEIHTLTGSDRGNQIICQLIRIAKLIGHVPRRIGLSATLGDTSYAAQWLSGGTNKPTDVPVPPQEKIKWRLGLEHFFMQNAPVSQPTSDGTSVKKPLLDAGYEYMYDCVAGKKCLVFSNSREETEYLTATFRQIAKYKNEPDRFLIHHGNLSASLREEAELKLKNDEENVVTCATVTLELGIDIGKLERIVQNQAPNSVMSFLQRLGRSGRRETPPEMMMVFREEDPLPNTPLPQLMPWQLLQGIAIIQLYIEDRFIEPPYQKTMPFSLLFHQTLSQLAARGEMTAADLAVLLLEQPVFSHVTKEDYRTLLLSMLNHNFLEMTEEKGLIVGLRGEQLLKSYKFFAVFKDTYDFTVRNGSDEIGTLSSPPPVGDRFALAGRVWEVEELDIEHKLLYVKSVDGKMEVSWPGDYGEIHTAILERMKKILEEDTVYPYLLPGAAKRLSDARHTARATGMLQKTLVPLGGYTWCMFPWAGTRSFRTMRRFLAKYADRFKISGIDFEGCYYVTFRMEQGSAAELLSVLKNEIVTHDDDLNDLVSGKELPVFDKYDDYIPAELLRRSFAADKLNIKELQNKFERGAYQ